MVTMTTTTTMMVMMSLIYSKFLLACSMLRHISAYNRNLFSLFLKSVSVVSSEVNQMVYWLTVA